MFFQESQEMLNDCVFKTSQEFLLILLLTSGIMTRNGEFKFFHGAVLF